MYTRKAGPQEEASKTTYAKRTVESREKPQLSEEEQARRAGGSLSGPCPT